MTENNSNLDASNHLEKDSENTKNRAEETLSEKDYDPIKGVQVVRSIVELLENSSLTEIEYRSGDFRVRAIKGSESVTQDVHFVKKSPDLQTVSVQTEQATLRTTLVAPQTAQQNLSHYVVKSPMVGTAYLSPKPGDPPFISVDSVVQEGQTVLIIEAMKTMNAIKAGKSGRVCAILVKNGDPVEFGQALVHIE
jgi:acetyl-CoA carboxylase biotin carboxyl carrier protein